MKKIMIEFYAVNEQEMIDVLAELNSSKLVDIDKDFKPIKIPKRENDKRYPVIPATFIVRGLATEENIRAISKLPFVVKVWKDTVIMPFLCNCPSRRRGTLDDVAECIGAGQLWSKGFKGEGIVIGIVDGGIDKTVIPNVVDGSSPSWGTIPPGGEKHGNMTATDALGIAPSAKLYDLNYTTGGSGITGFLSQALQAFNWAIQRFASDGTPHILSNSWGIYREDWDYDYATNPNHPFTLIVEAALDMGIKVLFAAGNCGKPCGACKCGDDTGGGDDIWGANGHEEVMTVGAVKLNNRRLVYSSQGPAALSNNKPDFCSYSGFKGYFRQDSGTSASCPVVAGAVALLLSYNKNLTQSQIKDVLQKTAKDIEAFGFDHNTGYGVIRIDNAYYEFEPSQKPDKDFRDRLCDHVYNVERHCVKWADEGSFACSQWADQGSFACSQWADQGSYACSQWADQGYEQCYSYYLNECHWYSPWNCIAGLFCLGVYWVANWVCQVWYWVANLVCQAWYWLANWVCQAWYWLAKWVCRLYVWIITSVTLTNCRCR